MNMNLLETWRRAAKIKMSLEVHTTFCVQIGGKSRVACECVVSCGQSSFGRYEHFARWSGRYEHYRPLKRAVWKFRPILTTRHNWLHAALRTSMQCDFFRPFGHKIICMTQLKPSTKWLIRQKWTFLLQQTFFQYLRLNFNNLNKL